MNWYNEPPAWSLSGQTIHITTGPKTDFWRKTHYGFIRDNGHFYYQEVAGDFVAEVKFSGQYQSLYDQAGLMLRLDEANWLKCGIEYVDGVQQASVVVTRDFSDWSVAPLPGNPASLWLRLTRQGQSVEIHYSLDGEHDSLLRVAYLPMAERVQVGPMAASPEGDGFSVAFEGFVVESQA